MLSSEHAFKIIKSILSLRLNIKQVLSMRLKNGVHAHIAQYPLKIIERS
jgi:hypothetical protein